MAVKTPDAKVKFKGDNKDKFRKEQIVKGLRFLGNDIHSLSNVTGMNDDLINESTTKLTDSNNYEAMLKSFTFNKPTKSDNKRASSKRLGSKRRKSVKHKKAINLITQKSKFFKEKFYEILGEQSVIRKKKQKLEEQCQSNQQEERLSNI